MNCMYVYVILLVSLHFQKISGNINTSQFRIGPKIFQVIIDYFELVPGDQCR